MTQKNNAKPPVQTIYVTGRGGAPPHLIEAVVEMLKQNLGVEVSIQMTEWATFLMDLLTGQYQMFSLGWIADYPDPYDFLDILFHSQSVSNHTNYSDPEVDRLLGEARVERNPEKRKELYLRVEQMVLDDAPWVPLLHGVDYWLTKPYVKGMSYPSMIIPRLKYITLVPAGPTPTPEPTETSAQRTPPTPTPTPIPPARRLTFVSDRDGNYEIYTICSDGSNEVPLTHSAADDLSPSWRPGTEEIAFTSNRGGNWDIYKIKADGTSLTQLTSSKGEDLGPSWSPDGSKIAFISNRDGNYEIYVMDPDGSNEMRLTINSLDDKWFNWSPDGEFIVYEQLRDDQRDVYVMRADGNDNLRIAVQFGYEPLSEPPLSPFAPDATTTGPGGGPILMISLLRDKDADGQRDPKSEDVFNDYPHPRKEPVSFFPLREGSIWRLLLEGIEGTLRVVFLRLVWTCPPIPPISPAA